jgi:hypothetical protein
MELGSSVLSCIVIDVLLHVVCAISDGIGDVIDGNISSGIGRLHDFILSTSLFSYMLEGRVSVVMTAAWSHRPTFRVGA